MIIAVIGSRNFLNYELLESILDSLPKASQFVSGGAKGADKLAELYAEKNQIPVVIFKPDWQKYGKAAGVIRNREIIEAAEMLVAFWDGESKGTASSLAFAKKKGMPIHTVISQIP